MRSEFCCAFHFYGGFNLLILTIFASSFSPKTIAQLVNSFTHEEDKMINSCSLKAATLCISRQNCTECSLTMEQFYTVYVTEVGF